MRFLVHIALFAALFILRAGDTFAAACPYDGIFNRYVRLTAAERRDPNIREPFFALEITCKSGHRNIRSSYGSDGTVQPNFVDGGHLTFRYPGGLTSDVSISDKQLGNLVYREANVQILKGASVVRQFRVHGHSFFDKNRPDCYSEVSDGGLVDELIQIRYPRSQAVAVLRLTGANGWFATAYGTYDERTGKPIFQRNDRLFDSPASCKSGACEARVYVGYGKEFYAVNKINTLGSKVCATRVQGEAGGPPLEVSGMPLNTLTNPDSALTIGAREALKNKVLPKLFGPGATAGELTDTGRGKTFLLSVVGPNRAMRVTSKSGYWYQCNLSLSVGIDADSGDLGEKVELTVLDLVEIRAPENVAALPAGTIAAGRTLQFLTSDGISDDGRIIRQWTYHLATLVADATGGFVEGL